MHSSCLSNDVSLTGPVLSSTAPGSPGSAQAAVLHELQRVQGHLPQLSLVLCCITPASKGCCQLVALHSSAMCVTAAVLGLSPCRVRHTCTTSWQRCVT